MKRITVFLLLLCLIPGLLCAFMTGSGVGGMADAATAKSHSGLLSIPDPTTDEIRAENAKYKTPTQRFSSNPLVVAPYGTGTLHQSVLEAATARVNYYRFIAKLPPLTNSQVKNSLAQHGAVLLGATKVMDHKPPKPSGMSDAFYSEAVIGTSTSCISSYNYTAYINNGHTWEEAEKHKTTWMQQYALQYMLRDYDPDVYRSLGHRRYLLSPYMTDFGFGNADSANGYMTYFLFTNASSTNPFNEVLQNVDYDYVAWPPSGNCPGQEMTMLKNFPWHISLNEDRYLVPAVLDANGEPTEEGDRSGVVVTVTREEDGKVWTFNQNSPKEAAHNNGYDDPYFVIDKQSYGFGPIREKTVSETGSGVVKVRYFASNAIIFRPDFDNDKTNLRGRYQVRVTGLKYVDGSPAEISYEVNFFSLSPCTHSWSEWEITKAPSCTEPGIARRVCSKCKEIQTQNVKALGHDWSAWRQTKAPSCTESGAEARSCSRCGKTETRTLAALGHAWSDWAQTAAPSCTGKGEESRMCARCLTVETRELAALGHDWTDVTVLKEPSCTEPGMQSGTCARCGVSQSDIEIPALGHDWDEGTVLTEPTWQEEGQRRFVCRRCGEAKTEPIPKLPNPFVDVPEGKYYTNAVLWAYYHDPRITGGTDATHFSPNKECKREQVVSFLYLAHGKPEVHLTENPFTDVKPGKYYYDAVMWALENKITGGVSTDKFGVGKSCTREQVVTFLWNAAGKPESTRTENPFTDVKEGKYYYKAVMWALEQGITGGVTKTSFGVGKTCTRGQIVTFLYKAMEK